MAAKPSEGTQTNENEENPGDCAGKKKSKFQAFKNLFVKKKRKEPPAPSRECNLKPSQSSSDVSVSGTNEVSFQPTHEPVARSNMGSKAVSHDSIFISEMENSTKEDTSQENTPGKVKALQLQLQQNIRIGSSPQGIVHKKLEDSGALSEDDGLPRSPPEITSLHEILALSAGKTSGVSQRRSSLSVEGSDSEDELESRETSSCPISPLNSSILLSSSFPGSHHLVDFTAPPSSVACLDNSAAKHKIAVRPKKRKAPAMSGNRVKGGADITNGLHIKEKTENKLKVVCGHEVSMPNADKSSVEQEAKRVEDMVQETQTENTLSLIAQEDDSSMKNTKTYETSFTGKQIVALPAETVEIDVDFPGSTLIVLDQENHIEEDTQTEIESEDMPHMSQSASVHETIEILDQLEPSEMEDDAVEMVLLEVIEDVECDLFEDPLRIQENTSVFESDEPMFNDKGQEHKEYENVLPSLTEIQKDLPEVSLSTSDIIVISTPQEHSLETEIEASVLRVDEHVGSIASECVIRCESTDNGNLFTSETLPELNINAATDQPRIIDTSSSDETVETIDLRIIESPTDLSIGGGNSKCPTGFINLASGSDNSDEIQCMKESSTEITKTIKPTDTNVDGKLRTSNKPVRFTVAPAWQRSLSVGSSVKDTSSSSKNKLSSAMKSESFDGTEDCVMDINQEDCRKCEKNNEMLKANKEDSCVAFGVRLRRTSSSRKYNEEYPEDQSKLHVPLVETGSIVVPARNVETPTKTTQLQSDFTKASKPSHTGEDKPWKKQKAEDLSSQENSEPAWITMAKQKQKGFQEHALAREHSVECDKGEGSDESSQKKSTAGSPQELEVEGAIPISAESPVVEERLPESGNNTQSAPPQNPDEPPWFSLAKKKAKAWSKMPQIVQ